MQQWQLERQVGLSTNTVLHNTLMMIQFSILYVLIKFFNFPIFIDKNSDC